MSNDTPYGSSQQTTSTLLNSFSASPPAMGNYRDITVEQQRLEDSRKRKKHWKRWGPYLSERAWGTVREDYSPNGDAWNYFPHDQARSRAYRWNEDGIAGISDRHQKICFAMAFWNGQDPILKERLFGLSGKEGNHGEDVKEVYYYLDNTPTHSYMKYLYRYPQKAFPYEDLLNVNLHRDKFSPEYELLDTGIFDENRFFDVVIEYAKGDVEDICVRVTVTNHGPETSSMHLLPTVWFRNTWAWKGSYEEKYHERFLPRPWLKDGTLNTDSWLTVDLQEPSYGERWLYCDEGGALLFTENETNTERLFQETNRTPYVKDAFHQYVIHHQKEALNPQKTGTKAAAHYQVTLSSGESKTFHMRLTNKRFSSLTSPFNPQFEAIFTKRKAEADQFYANIIPQTLSEDEQNVMRQSFAGLLWSKQFYHFVVRDWLNGDPAYPPPQERKEGRNKDWEHLFNADIISMPDKWEYPWYATWDLAFHCVPLAMVDPDFAKEQLILMLREWYMHPSGQMPAYEWAFGDVNPPVHAWAALQVFLIEKKAVGKGDTDFLKRVFHKLMINFTWWVNRKDSNYNNIFEGGFLGLDNISVIDRSTLTAGTHVEQSDGTSWMAMFTLNMLSIALQLTRTDKTYEDVASKFWEHFVYIAHALNTTTAEHAALWDETDGFYYDKLHLPDDTVESLKIHSLVGLIPLLGVAVLDMTLLEDMPHFKRRFDWFMDNRPDLIESCGCMRRQGEGNTRLFSLLNEDRLKRILTVVLDEKEFLSPYGIRSLSKRHRNAPYQLTVNGSHYTVAYDPGESTSGLFGGNSNWRGPIWFPINFLMVKALHRYHQFYGDAYKVECPTGSGVLMTLKEVSDHLSQRLTDLFLQNEQGKRPCFGGVNDFPAEHYEKHWKDLLLFHEYFHGDSGMGLGASHQTGWTGVIAKILSDNAPPFSAAATGSNLEEPFLVLQ